MTYLQKTAAQFASLLLVVLLGGLACISVWAIAEFEKGLMPEVEGKSVTVGKSITALIERAMSKEIAIHDLVGVEDLLRTTREKNREIGILAIADPAGKVLYSDGSITGAMKAHFLSDGRGPQADLSAGPSAAADNPGPANLVPPSSLVDEVFLIRLPIMADDEIKGFLHIGAKASYVRGIQQETFLDILVVLVVAFFIAIEILTFFSARGEFLELIDFLKAVPGIAAGNFGFRTRRPATWPLTAKIYGALERLQADYGRLKAKIQAESQRCARPLSGKPVCAQLDDFSTRYVIPDGGAQGTFEAMKVMRAPFFLFLMAEDLSRTFLPAFAASLYTPIEGISPGFIMGLPIMVFMLIVALSQPLLGGWSDRVGERKALLVGGLIALLAHLGTTFAFGVYDLLVWRAMAGVAWGIMFVGCQGIVLKSTSGATRTRGLAFFVGIIMISSACGPALGGILAEGIGFRGVLGLSSLLVLGAIGLTWRHIPDGASQNPRDRPTVRQLLALLGNGRFVMFLLTAAMPSKIILIGFCFYLIPLYMPMLDSSSAMAGRLIMLYAIMMVLLVPLASRWAVRPNRHWMFVVIGLLLSGLGGLMPLLLPPFIGVIALVALLGVGQAFSIAPQTAMVPELCPEQVRQLGESTVLGIYRLIERIGNALGPLVAALLLHWFSFPQTFAGIGGLLLVSAVIFGLTFLWAGSGRRLHSIPDGIQS
jgi:MFS family permease